MTSRPLPEPPALLDDTILKILDENPDLIGIDDIDQFSHDTWLVFFEAGNMAIITTDGETVSYVFREPMDDN